MRMALILEKMLNTPPSTIAAASSPRSSSTTATISATYPRRGLSTGAKFVIDIGAGARLLILLI